MSAVAFFGTLAAQGSGWDPLGSAYFGGTNSKITMGNVVNAEMDHDVTWEAWIRKEWSGAADQPALIKRVDGAEGAYLAGTSAGTYGTLADDGTNPPVTQALNMANGVWTHHMYVRDGTSQKWYVNGTLHDTDTLAAAPDSGGADFKLGVDANDAKFLNCYMRDVRIIDGAPTLAEAWARYNDGVPVDPVDDPAFGGDLQHSWLGAEWSGAVLDEIGASPGTASGDVSWVTSTYPTQVDPFTRRVEFATTITAEVPSSGALGQIASGASMSWTATGVNRTSGNPAIILCKTNGDSAPTTSITQGWYFGSVSGKLCLMLAFDSGTRYRIESNATFGTGDSGVIGATWDGATRAAKLYVNGAEVAATVVQDTTSGSEAMTLAAPIYLGREATRTVTWTRAADLTIWAGVLSAADFTVLQAGRDYDPADVSISATHRWPCGAIGDSTFTGGVLSDIVGGAHADVTGAVQNIQVYL